MKFASNWKISNLAMLSLGLVGEMLAWCRAYRLHHFVFNAQLFIFRREHKLIQSGYNCIKSSTQYTKVELKNKVNHPPIILS